VLGVAQGRKLLMRAGLHRGFTLIELLVAASISVILLLLAMPAYTLWIADGQIRNGAESIGNGLRYAQATAISQNANAQFVLGATGWTVAMVDTPTVVIQTASFDEGARHATFTGVDSGSVAATTVAFSALGQVIPGAANLVQVDVTMPAIAGTRPLRVLIGNGRTGVKLCDPKFPWPDAKGCPP
jgi:prepilin-type N-terminal cleavage/methylation domain-containing protein